MNGRLPRPDARYVPIPAPAAHTAPPAAAQAEDGPQAPAGAQAGVGGTFCGCTAGSWDYCCLLPEEHDGACDLHGIGELRVGLA